MQTNTAERPARPAGTTITPGLARQQRERDKSLRRLALLRRKASDEIERLLEFLDASDPYAATELELAIDDGPCDTDELEADHDRGEADYEPSLGSVDGPERGGQVRWAQGAVDREEACEDEGIAI